MDVAVCIQEVVLLFGAMGKARAWVDVICKAMSNLRPVSQGSSYKNVIYNTNSFVILRTLPLLGSSMLRHLVE